MPTGSLRGCTWSAASRLLALAVIEYVILLVAEFTLFKDAVVKFLEVVLGETVILKELLNFIVDVLGKLRALIPVLNLEFVDEQPLQLLSLLDVKESLLASLAHLGAGGGCTITLILFGSHR